MAAVRSAPFPATPDVPSTDECCAYAIHQCVSSSRDRHLTEGAELLMNQTFATASHHKAVTLGESVNGKLMSRL